jgi:hypothetical protein
MSTSSMRHHKTPWHLWAVAVLTLLWNGSGAYTIMMAQSGRLSNLAAKEAMYFTAQPLWFVVSTDIALFAPLAAAVALLLRSRTAPWLFAVSAIFILANNIYDLATGSSLALIDRGWAFETITIVLIAILQFAYAWAMKNRGVLQSLIRVHADNS